MTTKTLPPGVRWELAMLHLRAALKAAPVMKSGASNHARDAATTTYIHSVDGMVEQAEGLAVIWLTASEIAAGAAAGYWRCGGIYRIAFVPDRRV